MDEEKEFTEEVVEEDVVIVVCGSKRKKSIISSTPEIPEFKGTESSPDEIIGFDTLTFEKLKDAFDRAKTKLDNTGLSMGQISESFRKMYGMDFVTGLEQLEKVENKELARPRLMVDERLANIPTTRKSSWFGDSNPGIRPREMPPMYFYDVEPLAEIDEKQVIDPKATMTVEKYDRSNSINVSVERSEYFEDWNTMHGRREYKMHLIINIDERDMLVGNRYVFENIKGFLSDSKEVRVCIRDRKSIVLLKK